ncbi:orotidine-5'-phosphate decarboxylase [soil metagenome]
MSAEVYRQSQVELRDYFAIAFDIRGLDKAMPVMDEVGRYAAVAKFNAAKIRIGLDRIYPEVVRRDMKLWDDGKYNDTPRTMRDSVAESTAAGARLITVHMKNSDEALEAALKARDEERSRMQKELGTDYDPLVGTLLGITALTSYDEKEYKRDYGTDDIEGSVLELAKRAARLGLDGVVCSANELQALNNDEETRPLLKVTPGLILAGGEAGTGQKRVNTFAGAIALGADIVVGGSAITGADDISEAAQRALGEIAGALRRG